MNKMTATDLLRYILKAHDFEGALTHGDAILSPSIRDKIINFLEEEKTK